MHNRRMTPALLILSLTAAAGAAELVAADGVDQNQELSSRKNLPISTYNDDPFLSRSTVEPLPGAESLHRAADGRPLLASDRIVILDEPVIYRENRDTGEFLPFAKNPWPCAPLRGSVDFCHPPKSNANGDFVYRQDPRFPAFALVRDADGKPRYEDGLQLWAPQSGHLAQTTAFESASSSLAAVEEWSGRVLSWGISGQLSLNTHSFIDFNAFYAPHARGLYFGLVPYRLGGSTDPKDIKVYETASDWELVAHEAGHALHHALKPNIDVADPGMRVWTESLADQMAMWVSLRDARRTRALLAEVGGNFRSSNSLTRLSEAFAAIVGEGTGMRDAWHEKTVSGTSPEVHDRSEPLTGGVYELFVRVHADLLAAGTGPLAAVQEAGRIMGLFATRAGDYTPENRLTLEDVAKGYLKVDREFFGGRWRDALAAEFRQREIFEANSLEEWLAHEAALPKLTLPLAASNRQIEEWVAAHLDHLGLSPAFGLAVQKVVRDRGLGQTIVRVQLTEGRGSLRALLGNHGVLVFRASGRLADYHAPVGAFAQSGGAGEKARVATEEPIAVGLLREARSLSLDGHGVPLTLVRQPDGALAVEARVLGGGHLESYVEVFSAEHPEGLRLDVRQF
jgi:hypothetical protein